MFSVQLKMTIIITKCDACSTQTYTFYVLRHSCQSPLSSQSYVRLRSIKLGHLSTDCTDTEMSVC